MKTGYLVSLYPARSHTFIRREIEAARHAGLDVSSYSIRRCAPGELLCDLDRDEFARTWPILPVGAAALLRAHLEALLSRPGAYGRALATALRYRRPGLGGIVYGLLYFAEGIRLALQLRADGIGLLHIHFGNAGTLVGNCAAAYLGIPWGVTYHGASDFGHPTVTMMPWQIRRAAFVRCVSYFGLSQAMRQTSPENWAKLFVCYSGLPDPQALPRRDHRSRAHARPFRILVVGRLSPEKGQIGMLEAAMHLERHGIDYSITFAGDGPDRRMLEQRAAEQGLEKKCLFLGSIPEAAVYELMCECDVLVCPSLMEGLPQVLLEAMAVGLPVVAPGIAGIPELVEHRVCGMLYPPADWETLAQSVLEIACDPEFSLTMAERAREKVLDLFTLQTTIEPLIARMRAAGGS